MIECPVENLDRALVYDPVNGTLVRRQRPRECFSTDWGWQHQMAGWIVRKVGVQIDGKMYLTNRVCFAMYYRRWPTLYVDHKNGDRLDIRITNLREATNSQNLANQGPHKRSKSGHKGVYLMTNRGTYQVFVGHKYIGVYACLDDAIAAHTAASKQIYGEFHWEPK